MSKFNFNGMLAQNNQIKELPIDILVPYHNHQFQLYSGERLEDMIESIRQSGILNPILVQPIENGSKYEILSGHNRVEGAKMVGLEYIPAVIKENLSEDEAEIYVIETNVMQRGFNELLISEQANVLKLQHSRLFSQGKRNDIIRELEILEGKSTYNPVELTSDPLGQKLTRNIIAKNYGLGTTSVSRLLRINYLIQPFKDMIDSKAIALRVGVELSYISKDAQKMVYQIVTQRKKKIDIKLSKTIRRIFKDDPNITAESLDKLLFGTHDSKELKPIKVSIDRTIYYRYFNNNTSNDKVSDTVQKALELYFSSNKNTPILKTGENGNTTDS